MVRYSISLLWVSAPVEVRKGGKRATRVERKQRDDVLGKEKDSEQWGQGSRRQKEGVPRVPFKRTEGELLYSERNCNEMAAARSYAIAKRGKLRGTSLAKGVARERDVLIGMVTSMEQTESFRGKKDRSFEDNTYVYIDHFNCCIRNGI